MFFWDALCAQCGFWGAELWRVVPLEMVRSGNQRGDADFVQWGISQIVIFNGYFPNWDFLNRDFSEIFWTEIFEHPIFWCAHREMQSTQFQSLYQQLQTDFVLCFGARSSFSASRHHTTRDGLRKTCIFLHLQCLGNLMQSDANSIINDLISGLIKGKIYSKPPFPVNFPLYKPFKWP